MQWLKETGPVLFDFNKLSMHFTWKGQDITWKSRSWVNDDPLTAREAKNMWKDASEAYLCYMESDDILVEEEPLSKEIKTVVEKFSVFADPTSLPPQRKQDHFIHLDPLAKPINVRPYRYPQYQKDEIEKLIKELLNQGVIQNSTSPYSSPVLLVK